MHIPEYLIIDTIRRREQQQNQWEPVPLHLPLEAPRRPLEEEKDDEEEESPRVIIIQM